MSKKRIEINNPCPYCGGKELSYNINNPQYAIFAVNEETPPVVDINSGLVIVPITCKECGLTMLFRPKEEN